MWGIASLILPFAFIPGPASAMGLSKGDEALSPVLSELADPAVRALPPDQEAATLGVAESGPGSLLFEGARVLVNVRFEPTAADGPAALQAIGAEPIAADEAAGTATVAVDPATLDELGALPEVASASAGRAPVLYGPAPAAALGEGTCAGGSVRSEGLTQLKVDQARAAFGLTGAGVTVGVLSDSFDTATAASDGSGPIATHAAQDVLSADLPGPGGGCVTQQAGVAVLEDGAAGKGSDEGRAMLQIVHDLAPDATLAFATAFRSEASFAQNIERLAAPAIAGGAGAKVIVDDVAYFEEPFFQDGPVAAAIAKVTAEGVTYLTSAGNDNLFEGENEIASWEAPAFRDSAGCPTAVQRLRGFNGTHCMDFDPGAAVDRIFGITVAAGATLSVDLQWAEPWNGVTTDLDAFLLNAGGEVLATSGEGNSGIGGTQRPLEIIQWKNTASTPRTVQLAINRFSGGLPRLKFALLQNGSGVTKTEYPRSAGGDIVGPTIFGHAGAPSAIAVAAVSYADSSAPERFSSRGPVTHYFGPVAGTGAAPALAAPEAIVKPDLAATDCGATTFFARRYDGATWRFCGTSAAAPHAAAVAALLSQRDAAAPVATIRAALTGTATPVGAFPATAVGSGLIDAYAAIASLPGAPAIEPLGVPVTPPPAQPEAPPATPVPAAPTTPPGARTPPDTFITRHPPKLVHARVPAAPLRFRFGSSPAGARFLCKIDRGRLRGCGVKFSRRFAVGAHVLRVKARGAGGANDPSPATFRFRVEPIR